jgi:hypothetical protein
VLSIFEVKSIEEELDAVCVCNKVILPCVNPTLVTADIELLLCFTKPKVIR